MKTIYHPAYRQLIRRLIDSRHAAGLTQAQVSKRLRDCSPSWISSVERCVIKPDLLQFCRLCRAYGIEPGALMAELAEELSDE